MDFDSDGISLHYEVHGPESGAPIVLVHGFASHYRLNWVGTRWQETLTGAGFRVIGLDCRGHGDSDKPHDPRAYESPVMAADVRRLLDHLGIESAHYLGFSMGARIGIQCVLDFPSRRRSRSHGLCAAACPRTLSRKPSTNLRGRGRTTTSRRWPRASRPCPRRSTWI